MPYLLRYTLDEYGTARRTAVVRCFIDALTRGGKYTVQLTSLTFEFDLYCLIFHSQNLFSSAFAQAFLHDVTSAILVSQNNKMASMLVSQTVLGSMNSFLEPLANGRNIVGCYVLHPFAHPVACCALFGVVAESLKPVKFMCQQLPTFLLFRDCLSIVQ